MNPGDLRYYSGWQSANRPVLDVVDGDEQCSFYMHLFSSHGLTGSTSLSEIQHGELICPYLAGSGLIKQAELRYTLNTQLEQRE